MSMIAESAKFTKIFKKSRGGSYCCVAGCHCTRDKCFGLGFFAIPREGVSKDQDKWRAGLIRSIGRSDKNFNPLKAKICSRHFEEKCIKKGNDHCLLTSSPLTLLVFLGHTFSLQQSLEIFHFHREKTKLNINHNQD